MNKYKKYILFSIISLFSLLFIGFSLFYFKIDTLFVPRKYSMVCDDKKIYVTESAKSGITYEHNDKIAKVSGGYDSESYIVLYNADKEYRYNNDEMPDKDFKNALEVCTNYQITFTRFVEEMGKSEICTYIKYSQEFECSSNK